MRRCTCWMVLAALAAVAFAPRAGAQVTVPPQRGFATNVIVPQARVFARGGTGRVEITGVDVAIEILEQASVTTMDVSLRNSGGGRLEAEMMMPVPDGAVIKGFTFQGAGSEATAQLLPKEESRRIYESIVSRMRDPAILEFLDSNLVRSSVFPVDAHGTQKVRLVYEALLPSDGTRVDYVLPRSESVEYEVPWHVTAVIRSASPISTVYSPTHETATKRRGAASVVVTTTETAAREPGPFKLSYVRETEGMSATVFAYPDAGAGGGYFLLLAGLPATAHDDLRPVRREVTLVLDRSGSMAGEKLDQVREAALQILSGLEDGERFNIIAYNDAVDMFAGAPVENTRANVAAAGDYLRKIKSSGGTNIYDALSEALRQKPVEGTLPIVLFLTDGLPTVGRTNEAVIGEMAVKGNTYEKRVFTFGVGVDVNVPLLERVARDSRATSTFVLPKEDVEAKVALVFRRLAGPVLASPELAVFDASGSARPRVAEVIPSKVPDLFEADQLVVLGRYRGEEKLDFVFGGDYFGRERKFRFAFDPCTAKTDNSFVPRLWASRRIGVLVDAVRQLGAETGTLSVEAASRDPRVKELVDEIVRLSTQFGVLTEYTAFLAREGTDLSDGRRVMSEATSNLVNRGMNTRNGLAAVNQAANSAYQSRQQSLNGRNFFYDEKMARVAVASVQQVSDRAFYNRAGRWVDSRVAGTPAEKPTRTVALGSPEWMRLAEKLADAGRRGTMSLRGDIVLEMDGETILVRGDAAR